MTNSTNWSVCQWLPWNRPFFYSSVASMDLIYHTQHASTSVTEWLTIALLLNALSIKMEVMVRRWMLRVSKKEMSWQTLWAQEIEASSIDLIVIFRLFLAVVCPICHRIWVTSPLWTTAVWWATSKSLTTSQTLTSIDTRQVKLLWEDNHINP